MPSASQLFLTSTPALPTGTLAKARRKPPCGSRTRQVIAISEAAGDSVPKIFRPLRCKPSSTLVASTSGRSMSVPGSDWGEHRTTFYDFKDHSAEYVIYWAVESQDAEFDRLGLKFETLFGRRLQPID